MANNRQPGSAYGPGCNHIMERKYCQQMLLAFDQSPTSTGWALFESGDLVMHGLVIVSNKIAREGGVRIGRMGQKLLEIMEKAEPTRIVFEDVVLQRSPATMKELAQLQGVIIGYCREHGIPYSIMYPNTWRKMLQFRQGKGILRENLKKQARDYVKKNWKINASEDECDAICIGSAYLREKGEKHD